MSAHNNIKRSAEQNSGQFLDYDTLEENLIAEVKKEPVLYDKSCASYRKLEVTEEAWKRISDALRVSVGSCKKRWKSLRDCYIKHYRAGLVSNQQQHANRKTWAYYDNLSFLAQHIQLYRVGEIEYCKSEHDQSSQDVGSTARDNSTPELESVLQSNETSSETNDELDQAEYIEIREYDTPAADTVGSEKVDYTHSGAAASKALSTLSRALYTRVGQTLDQDHITNSDERFLLSCAPALQRLSKHKNALVRLKIQQLLYDMEFGGDTDGTSETVAKKIKLG